MTTEKFRAFKNISNESGANIVIGCEPGAPDWETHEIIVGSTPKPFYLPPGTVWKDSEGRVWERLNSPRARIHIVRCTKEQIDKHNAFFPDRRIPLADLVTEDKIYKEGDKGKVVGFRGPARLLQDVTAQYQQFMDRHDPIEAYEHIRGLEEKASRTDVLETENAAMKGAFEAMKAEHERVLREHAALKAEQTAEKVKSLGRRS